MNSSSSNHKDNVDNDDQLASDEKVVDSELERAFKEDDERRESSLKKRKRAAFLVLLLGFPMVIIGFIGWRAGCVVTDADLTAINPDGEILMQNSYEDRVRCSLEYWDFSNIFGCEYENLEPRLEQGGIIVDEQVCTGNPLTTWG